MSATSTRSPSPISSLRSKPTAATDTKVRLSKVDSMPWGEVLKIMQDNWRNEEIRFSNLNTRAVALVSATSVVTALISVFSRDLFLSSSSPLWGDIGFVARGGSVVALAMLGLAVAIAVAGVLMPGGRPIFGNNEIAGLRQPDGSVTEGAVLDASGVNRVASFEYASIFEGLANRNRRKAYWLSWAYLVFGFGVLTAAISTIITIWATAGSASSTS